MLCSSVVLIAWLWVRPGYREVQGSRSRIRRPPRRWGPGPAAGGVLRRGDSPSAPSRSECCHLLAYDRPADTSADQRQPARAGQQRRFHDRHGDGRRRGDRRERVLRLGSQHVCLAGAQAGAGGHAQPGDRWASATQHSLPAGAGTRRDPARTACGVRHPRGAAGERSTSPAWRVSPTSPPRRSTLWRASRALWPRGSGHPCASTPGAGARPGSRHQASCCSAPETRSS